MSKQKNISIIHRQSIFLAVAAKEFPYNGLEQLRSKHFTDCNDLHACDEKHKVSDNRNMKVTEKTLN